RADLLDPRLDVVPRDAFPPFDPLQIDVVDVALVVFDDAVRDVDAEVLLCPQHRQPQLAFEHDLVLGRPQPRHRFAGVAARQDIEDRGLRGGTHAREVARSARLVNRRATRRGAGTAQRVQEPRRGPWHHPTPHPWLRSTFSRDADRPASARFLGLRRPRATRSAPLVDVAIRSFGDRLPQRHDTTESQCPRASPRRAAAGVRDPLARHLHVPRPRRARGDRRRRRARRDGHRRATAARARRDALVAASRRDRNVQPPRVRDLARSADRSRNVLARLLDEPQLVSAIRSLDTSTFHALVEHVGIADAGELVAMATDEQLLHVLDETLWSQRPGVTETFSHHAFVTWLEVLLEAGEGHLVDRVCALPEELVAMGIHRVALVVPSDALGIDLASADWDDAERAEKALDACLYLELD